MFCFIGETPLCGDKDVISVPVNTMAVDMPENMSQQLFNQSVTGIKLTKDNLED